MGTIYLATFLEVVLWIVWVMFWLLALAGFVWSLADLFRRRDLGGPGKAGWILVLFFIPVLGVLIYIVARPAGATEETVIPWAPGPGVQMSASEEIAYAQGLLEQGKITQENFEEIKFKALH